MNLRSLRLDRAEPLTLKDCFKRTGFHPSHWSNVERGMIGSGPRFHAAVAKLHGISIPEARALCIEAYRAGRHRRRRRHTQP